MLQEAPLSVLIPLHWPVLRAACVLSSTPMTPLPLLMMSTLSEMMPLQMEPLSEIAPLSILAMAPLSEMPPMEVAPLRTVVPLPRTCHLQNLRSTLGSLATMADVSHDPY
jgi:hypothetical protein